jgi:hypothetical protein
MDLQIASAKGGLELPLKIFTPLALFYLFSAQKQTGAKKPPHRSDAKTILS